MRITAAKALFASRYVNLEQAAQVSGAKWEPFQIHMLNNMSRFGIYSKSRQIAWSFTAALDAVIDSILCPDTPHIFVSINQDEAKEKIRYAINVIEAIDEPVRPRLTQRSQQSLEFSNRSRMISHPCRPPRGKPRTRIYFDEIAHYQKGLDREIYRAGLPSTVKGDGYIRLGSSPMGASGLFWEIMTEAVRPYPGYKGHRLMVPWWHVSALSLDVPTALQLAPRMATEERVQTFGTPALLEIFTNMFLEDFQQEFECAWLDEATAWISWDVIKRNQSADLACWHAQDISDAALQLETVKRALESGQIEQSLAGGIDVGRKKDLTEFFILGKTTTGDLPVRWMISLDKTEYDDQEDIMVQIIKALPFVRVLVDETGIGSQLAENLRKHTGGVAKGVTFTQGSKERWAVEARIRAERGSTPMPLDRALAYQIHSIKRMQTGTGKAKFDTERNEKHHADKFWAWALAIYAARQSIREFVNV